MKKRKGAKCDEPMEKKLAKHEKEEGKQFEKLAKMHKKVDNKRRK